jgi:hypothetical protein
VGGWSAPRSGRFTFGKDSVPIAPEAGWAPGLVWTYAKNLDPTGIFFYFGSMSLYTSTFYVRYEYHFFAFTILLLITQVSSSLVPLWHSFIFVVPIGVLPAFIRNSCLLLYFPRLLLFDPRTVQPVASCYTDWATQPTHSIRRKKTEVAGNTYVKTHRYQMRCLHIQCDTYQQSWHYIFVPTVKTTRGS